mgnify:CR=1 FL=1
MNLDFSDDQKLLQEEAKKFLTKEDALKICLLYTSDAADE